MLLGDALDSTAGSNLVKGIKPAAGLVIGLLHGLAARLRGPPASGLCHRISDFCAGFDLVLPTFGKQCLPKRSRETHLHAVDCRKGISLDFLSEERSITHLPGCAEHS